MGETTARDENITTVPFPPLPGEWTATDESAGWWRLTGPAGAPPRWLSDGALTGSRWALLGGDRFPGAVIARAGDPAELYGHLETPGARFYTYPAAPPKGETWGYGIDGSPAVYGPGWYPFHDKVCQHQTHPDRINGTDVNTGKTQPTSVRLAPDTKWLAWGNEYVTLHPKGGPDATAAMHLYVRRQGAGAMVFRTDIGLNIKTRTVTVPDTVPAHLRDQAETKARRALAVILTGRSERRAGLAAPVKTLHPHLQPKDDGTGENDATTE